MLNCRKTEYFPSFLLYIEFGGLSTNRGENQEKLRVVDAKADGAGGVAIVSLAGSKRGGSHREKAVANSPFLPDGKRGSDSAPLTLGGSPKVTFPCGCLPAKNLTALNSTPPRPPHPLWLPLRSFVEMRTEALRCPVLEYGNLGMKLAYCPFIFRQIILRNVNGSTH